MLAAKFPMLAFVVLGKLRGSQPLQAGFFAFKADRWLALQLAAVCLAIPLLEVPVYSMRVRAALKFHTQPRASHGPGAWLSSMAACRTALGGNAGCCTS